MRWLEEKLFSYGMPEEALMEKVGLRMKDWFMKNTEFLNEGVLVLVGPGHNGGDGLVLARELYLAGVDVLENDKLGRLGLTIQGCKKRDKFVLELCRKNNVPIQISMGGGYSVNIKDILEAHSNTYRLAQEIFF